jgi:hypothetical protein
MIALKREGIETIFRLKPLQLMALFKQSFGGLIGSGFYWRQGNMPMCLVAHVDIAGPDEEFDKPIVWCRNIIARKDGILGGDDRAGCLAIYHILSQLRNEPLQPYILLCDGEEHGGTGVKSFLKANLCTFKKINLCVEIDRRGCNDFVTYTQELDDSVRSYVETFGFKSAWGTYSDISDLIDQYSVSAVNVSAGFYNNHSKDEYVVLDELMLTIGRVLSMIADPFPKKVLMAKKVYAFGYRGTTTYKKGEPWTNPVRWVQGRDKYDRFTERQVKATPGTYKANIYGTYWECLRCKMSLLTCHCTEKQLDEFLDAQKPKTEAVVIPITDGKPKENRFYRSPIDGKDHCAYCGTTEDKCTCSSIQDYSLPS